jgi:hypothetical protein
VRQVLDDVLLLRTIRTDGPLPRSAVVRLSGLSRPTVNEVVEALLAEGLILESFDETDDGPRRPGPKARMPSFNARRWLVVGVDIGAAKIFALLSDLDGDIISSARSHTPRNDAQGVLNGVRQAVQEVVTRAGASRTSVAIVVVGTPGVVDPQTGVVRFVPQFPEWHGQPPKGSAHQFAEAPGTRAERGASGRRWGALA